MDPTQVFAFVTASISDWLSAATATGSQTIGSMCAVNAFDADQDPGHASMWVRIAPINRGSRTSAGAGNMVESKSGGLAADPRRGWLRRPVFHILASARKDGLDPYDKRLRALADAIENAFSRRLAIPFKEFSNPSAPTEAPETRLRIRRFEPLEESRPMGDDGGVRTTGFELELEYIRLI